MKDGEKYANQLYLQLKNQLPQHENFSQYLRLEVSSKAQEFISTSERLLRCVLLPLSDVIKTTDVTAIQKIELDVIAFFKSKGFRVVADESNSRGKVFKMTKDGVEDVYVEVNAVDTYHLLEITF